jgi:hypothetical protein
MCALLLRSEVFERKLLLLLDMLKEKVKKNRSRKKKQKKERFFLTGVCTKFRRASRVHHCVYVCALLLRSEVFERNLLLLLAMLKEKVQKNRSRKKKQKKERFFLTGVCKKFRRASRVHLCGLDVCDIWGRQAGVFCGYAFRMCERQRERRSKKQSIRGVHIDLSMCLCVLRIECGRT